MDNYYPESGATGKSFSEHVADLNARLGGKVFFVEIGAMDGVRHDALHQHIANNPDWSGVLVEPLPDMFKKLKMNYSGHKNLAFERAAITEKDGFDTIARIPLSKVNKDMPDWADGISTLRPDIHLISQQENLKKHMKKEKIKTMTVATLVKKHNIKNIDLLQTDTEGYDLEIFTQFWNVGFRPFIIKIEIVYMLYKDIKQLRWFLNSQGYLCFYQSDDMIAIKQ